MAKRSRRSKLPPPLNLGDDLGETEVIASGVMEAGAENGILTIVTPVGYYVFLIDDESANGIVQDLRKYLRGDSASVLDRATDDE